jgi:hypothetical protein
MFFLSIPFCNRKILNCFPLPQEKDHYSFPVLYLMY